MSQVSSASLISGSQFPREVASLAEIVASTASRFHNRYRLYAEWRCRRPMQESTKFFQDNWNASLIWTLVMRGHYMSQPPTLTECFNEANCSRGTVRSILGAARSKGFLYVEAALDDHRKTLVHPSSRCVIEYERMVDTFLQLADVLSRSEVTRERPGRRNSVNPINKYVAYAEWRIGLQRHRSAQESTLYFRQSRDHTTIWTTVMRGHYAGSLPSISDCLNGLICSRDTGRKILLQAEELGYLVLNRPEQDSRKRLVVPSHRCISEYEALVDTLSVLDVTLQAQACQPRRTGTSRTT